MTSLIRSFIHKDQLCGSTRSSGNLEIVKLGAAEYCAFIRTGTSIDQSDYVRRIPDFPGWEKLTFADYDQRKQALEVYGDLLFEADISPAKRYLVVNNVRLEAPLTVYVDIETDSRVPVREQAEFAPGRILAITAVGPNGEWYVKALEEDDDDAETHLLTGYWQFVDQFDQVSAWNGSGFDFPVIEKRSQKLLRKCQDYWNARRRLLLVDQLLCFKRHHMAPESGDDKTSMKLGDICKAILGETKTDFDARKTWESWVAGGAERQRMLDYCKQDTALLPKLEAATGYLALQQTLGEVSYTPVDTHGLKPMPQVDGIILRGAHLRQTHLPSKKQPTGEEDQYEGAYVMPPTSIGIHRTVHVADFASLYPTVIRSLNIGWETKGYLGCTAFGTGVSFGVDSESMLAAACRELMEQRTLWKKKAKIDPDDKYAERMSKAYKIACNSIYGTMGCSWSRYYDVEIAESVTLGAKALILETIKEAVSVGYHCLYSDTDAAYVTGCTVEEFKKFVDHCNTVLYPRMLTEIGANLAFNCISLDYEKAFDRLVFPLGNEGKPTCKRYFGSFLHYAFRPKSKPEIRGLEYMRGDSIRFARHMQKEAIDRILRGETDEQLEEWVLSMRHRMMVETLPIEEIVISKGLGQELKDYKPVTNTAHVRLARELLAEGEDIGQGSKIAYVIADGSVSPTKIISAEDYVGEFDRHHAWMKQVYPATLRVLAGAFPKRNWKRWLGRRPVKPLVGQLDISF